PASSMSTRRQDERACRRWPARPPRPPRRAARRGDGLDGGLPPLLRPQPLCAAGAAPGLLPRPLLDRPAHLHRQPLPVLRRSRPRVLSCALAPPLRPLAMLGRWPLTFYMLHQPLLIGALMGGRQLGWW